jgi:4-hydroxy-tetrahydrodipicolinate synthase
MAKKFRGTYTAIITPFNNEEDIDYPALSELIEFQISSGVDGIVVCGTTGESPTLSPDEHNKVIEFVTKKVNHRVLVIAGTGSNCTREAIELTKHAEECGVDATLQVNPYYNKPTQEGLFLHFKSIADSTSLPIILYNIKGRTGVNLETPTLLRLISSCKNILAVKEASGDLNQIKEVISKKPDYFSVLSGDDNLTLEVIKNGGDGVVSVASNVVPKEMTKLVLSALNKDYAKAEEIQTNLSPLFLAEFIETNPIPIKYMLYLMGYCKEVYRLPLCSMRLENKPKVEAVLGQLVPLIIK